jgi:MoxR-like ATPase
MNEYTERLSFPTQDEIKFLERLNDEGHIHFVEKTKLLSYARNWSYLTVTPMWFIKNPSLQYTDDMIRLPDLAGIVDKTQEHSFGADKASTFSTYLKAQPSYVPPPPPTFYSVSIDNNETPKQEKDNLIMKTEVISSASNSQECKIAIPGKSPLFVPFGFYEDAKMIIKSGVFHPFFVTGLSGNGKTFGITEACAELKRQCVRIPVTVESDEDSLLGGFRLVNGSTQFQLGPVVEAMLAGAICILDEVDKASSKIMCLQPVLEGEPIFLKRINRLIVPAKGFNIAATANTKGEGNESGTFVTSNILDEAFLERFACTFEQDYPPPAVEKKILSMLLASFDGLKDDDFVRMLVDWADSIRKSYKDGGVNSVITTRRLTHIIRNYAIFGQDKHKAVEMAISRFNSETKASFMSLWIAKCPKVTGTAFGSKAAGKTTFSNDADDRPF